MRFSVFLVRKKEDFIKNRQLKAMIRLQNISEGGISLPSAVFRHGLHGLHGFFMRV